MMIALDLLKYFILTTMYNNAIRIAPLLQWKIHCIYGHALTRGKKKKKKRFVVNIFIQIKNFLKTTY